jgi:putative DNA primase/helicase
MTYNINLEEIEHDSLNWKDVYAETQGFHDGKRFIPGDKKKAVDIASDILTRDFDFKTMLDNEELWFYNEGYYEPVGESLIKEIIQKQKAVKEILSVPLINEIINSVKRKTFINRELFEAPLNLICLKNGIYDLKEKKLIEHSPKYYFKNKININYDFTATCPKIDEFIKSTLEEKYIELGYEIPAWGLYRQYFIQKAIMLTGTGQNGKSVYLDLLTTILGRKNCSSETLQSICNTSWGTAELYGKLANICGDLPSVLLKDSGEFKKLTSGFIGDSISAQKKFQNPFQFVNNAKLLFATNEVPESKDQSDGFFRRWTIIDFPYTFVSGLKEDEYKGFIKKENKELINELTTENELEGFLVKIINKLEILLEKKQFSVSPTTEEVKNKYNMKSNSSVVFIETYITDEVEDEKNKAEPFVLKEFLLSEYLSWCETNGIQAKSSEAFYKHIKDRWNPSTEKRSVELGKRKNVYVGISYNSWRDN